MHEILLIRLTHSPNTPTHLYYYQALLKIKKMSQENMIYVYMRLFTDVWTMSLAIETNGLHYYFWLCSISSIL